MKSVTKWYGPCTAWERGMENARTWHWRTWERRWGWAGEGTTVTVWGRRERHGCIRGLFPHQRNSMWCKSRCVPIGHFRVSVPGHPLIEPQQRRAKFTVRARNATNKNPPLLSLSISLSSLSFRQNQMLAPDCSAFPPPCSSWFDDL
jgi:hypothetical protein